MICLMLLSNAGMYIPNCLMLLSNVYSEQAIRLELMKMLRNQMYLEPVDPVGVETCSLEPRCLDANRLSDSVCTANYSLQACPRRCRFCRWSWPPCDFAKTWPVIRYLFWTILRFVPPLLANIGKKRLMKLRVPRTALDVVSLLVEVAELLKVDPGIFRAFVSAPGGTKALLVAMCLPFYKAD